MSKKKILFAVLIGLSTSFVAPTLNASAAETTSVSTAATQTGWVKSGDKWYYYDQNGTMKTNDWVQDNGKWYHVDATGIMQTGWFKDTDGHWYHLDKSGAMETGWFKDTDGNWYYLSTKEGGPYGSMQTGWFYDNDTYHAWFYLNPNSDGAPTGAVRTGWIEVNGIYYYLKANGAMAANEVVENQYYVNKSGEWIKPINSFNVLSTAYTGDTQTSTGIKPSYNPNGISTIAVDPSVIPYGTLVYVEGYGVAIAADTGGDIKGNRIDVFLNSESACITWGRKTVRIDILAYKGQW